MTDKGDKKPEFFRSYFTIQIFNIEYFLKYTIPRNLFFYISIQVKFQIIKVFT